MKSLLIFKINNPNFCHALDLDFFIIIIPLDKEFEELLIRINRINNNQKLDNKIFFFI